MLSSKIEKIVKKLGKCTLNDIEIITEEPEAEIKKALAELQNNKVIKENKGEFFYLEPIKTRSSKDYGKTATVEKLIWQNEEDKKFFTSPEWAKKQAFKYLMLIKAVRGLKGKALRSFVKDWNEENPEFKTSYQSIQAARLVFYKEGRMGLLAKYGKSKGKTSVKDEYFEMFKEFYLTSLKPSVKACVKEIKEHFKVKENEFFPSPISFSRRLKYEMTQKEIDYARN